MSWKWELCDNGTWISNSLRFATETEARAYGFDLSVRWLVPMSAVDKCRATRCDDPVTEGAVKTAGQIVAACGWARSRMVEAAAEQSRDANKH